MRASRAPEILATVTLAVLSALLLYSVGRPVASADTWLHLALGEAYLEEGPWLDADPMLHTATGPPVPAAWLSDVSLTGLQHAFGFQGLRVAHLLAAVAILGLVGAALRRASGSWLAMSLGSAIFLVLASYRLFQLRPHLVSLLMVLLLYRLLLEDKRPPGTWRIALSTLLMALWANAHAAFLLGPILLGAAVVGLCVAAPLRNPVAQRQDRERAARLVLALALGALATLLNPGFLEPHLAFFTAGTSSPLLSLVIDEWRGFPAFSLPVEGLPPSMLSWTLVWGLLIATPVATWQCARGWGATKSSASSTPGDPALVALALASLVAMAVAVRFMWLAVFPLLLLAAVAGPELTRRSRRAFVTAVASLLLVPGFLYAGPWKRLREGVPSDITGYLQSYATRPYYAHAAWMLRDAGIRGRLFNDYSTGNFFGYWLAPALKVFTAGSLNLPPEAMRAHRALRERRGLPDGPGFDELLERYRVDVFLGVGLPARPRDARRFPYTISHVESSPGWVPVFRNLNSGVWVRRGPGGRENLAQAEHYYRREGVPFDVEQGFDPALVIAEAPEWALQHGLVPNDFSRLEAFARGMDSLESASARNRVAAIRAALGDYEGAAALDRRTLNQHPHYAPARRRLVWCLLHLDRAEEALAATHLLGTSRARTIDRHIANAARLYAETDDAPSRAGLLARLQVFTPAEARALFRDSVDPFPRPENARVRESPSRSGVLGSEQRSTAEPPIAPGA